MMMVCRKLIFINHQGNITKIPVMRLFAPKKDVMEQYQLSHLSAPKKSLFYLCQPKDLKRAKYIYCM